MGKPILYGYDISPPVRAVLLTANAIGLDFEYREVNIMAGAHLSEDYLKKNPQHTIPMLEDDGKCIWDSHAIAVYLIEKYGDDKFLYPKDLYKRAIIDQRLHFDSGVLFPTFRRIVVNIYLFVDFPFKVIFFITIYSQSEWSSHQKVLSKCRPMLDTKMPFQLKY